MSSTRSSLPTSFGVDALRYFLLREVTLRPGRQLQRRGDRHPRQCRTRQQLRQSRPAHLNQIVRHLRRWPAGDPRPSDADDALFDTVCTAVARRCRGHIEEFAFSRAIESWIQAVFACNAYIDEQAPWALKKTDPERMQTVLATLYICIAILAVGIRPLFLKPPTGCSIPWALRPTCFGTFDGSSHWYSPLAETISIAQPQPLFPRLELEEEPETAHEADR